MKQWDQSLLYLAAEIDQVIAATDEAQPGERRVLDHVLL